VALKATIFKVDLQLADLDRHHYADYPLTLARHPSETDERLMMRVLAFALHAHERLAFGKGLSDDDEPDLWRHDLTGAIEQWIEVGLPDARRLRRAAGRAAEVVVLPYGGRAAELWWSANAADLRKLSKLSVVAVDADASQALAGLATRTLRLQATVQDGVVGFTDGTQVVEVQPHRWR
jgi:uncharacterized protein YaeQ